jgi:hypothetical protein
MGNYRRLVLALPISREQGEGKLQKIGTGTNVSSIPPDHGKLQKTRTSITTLWGAAVNLKRHISRQYHQTMGNYTRSELIHILPNPQDQEITEDQNSYTSNQNNQTMGIY